LEADWKERGVESVSYHIGLTTGNALVGNVGSEQRMDFTAIGDNVTLASKLEALNRRFGTQVLLTDDMHEVVQDKFVLRTVGRVLFDGNTEPTNLYELLGRADEGQGKGKAMREQAAAFNQALGVYIAGHFSDAVTSVESFLRKYPDDVVAQRLLERCVLLSDAPPANWAGVEQVEDHS
jgi:adenylate cyclase